MAANACLINVNMLRSAAVCRSASVQLLFSRSLQRWEQTVYKGPFDPKKTPVYKGVPRHRFVEEAERIKKEQAEPYDVCAFHLVRLVVSMKGRPWTEKVSLRRLGLHYKHIGLDTLTVVPNTPHYNRLLFEVKHLIELSPLKLADGVPKQEDVGQTKVDVNSSSLRISPTYKTTNERLDKAERPAIFQGTYLRNYLKRRSFVMKSGESWPIEGN